MEIKTRIRGLRELDAVLRKLGPEIASKVGDQAARAGAKVVVDDARQRVPVRSGALRESIVVVGGRQAQRLKTTATQEANRVAVVTFKKPHSRRAHLTEFGTRHSAAKPFLRPALDGNQNAVLQKMADAMRRGVLRESKKLAKPLR